MTRLDAGRTHDVLIDQAWLQLPEPQREAEFIRLMEECIEPDPIPAPAIPRLFIAIYLLSNSWLILGSVVRLAISLTHHIPIDALPFLSLVIGNGALIAYLRYTPRARKECNQ